MSIAQDLAETVKPEVERHIIEVLGYKPQRHEIVTPTQEIVFEGVVHEKFDMVCNLVQNNIPIFLTGAAGTGKNHLVKDVAKALGLNFYFTNAITSEYKLSGFIDANGRFHETAFYNAFSKGGIFFFDEVDASTPEALAYTHAAISNGYCDFPTGHVEAHPDFRVIAAGNTFGTGADLEYVGRFQLDAATLDRFALVNIDYSPEIESAMAMGDAEILDFARDFRKALAIVGMKFVVSYRGIQRIAKMKDIHPDAEVVKTCLTKSLDADDLRIIKENMKVKDNRWAKALAV
jgi:cobaltochelatase CobS